LSLRDNQITRHANIACVIVGPRQSSSRRDRRNGHPDCRCVPIQIVALHKGKEPKVALVACMRKLIIILNTMLARRQKWNPGRHAVA
jgi:transposase